VTPAPLLLELPLELELLELELLEPELLELDPLELAPLELELLELLELELLELELELLEVSGPLTVPPPQPTTMMLAHAARMSARTAARLNGRETILTMS
jgi:hypothetical protein